MENIRAHVGAQIRQYRQAAGLTVDALAHAIHKSKSTVSKYESGAIALDIETLVEIAQVLRITPNELLRVQREHVTSPGTGLFSHREFLYLYDGKSRRISRSVVDHFHGTDNMGVTLFYDVPSFEDLGSCRCLYTGRMFQRGLVRNYVFTNQMSDMEQVLLYSIDSLDRSAHKLGVLMGLSFRTMMPVTIKALLFDKEQREDDTLIAQLMLTKKDIHLAKRYNVLTLENESR